ncbi:MAG: CvpA family protein [Clostridia bacterium]|nr:CvpA family protein [Clostridia bacterium]
MFDFFLYLPFVTVFSVVALIFSISGFRKGLWYALCSLGLTILSALCSIPFAKSLAPSVTRSVLGQVALKIEGEALRAFLLPLLEGFLCGIVSLFLFSLIFLLLFVILKVILNCLKHPKLVLSDTEKKGFRWGGLAIGLVDALLIAFLLILPLYGTLATVVPLASPLMKFAGAEAEAVEPYLSQMENHPLVTFYGNGIGAALHQTLDASSNEIASLEEVIDATATLSDYLRAYEEAEGANKDAVALDLVRYLLDHVVDEPWSYSLFCIAREGAKESDEAAAGILAELFDMSEEDFRKNARPLLERAESALLLKQSLGSLGDQAQDALENGIGALLGRA